MKKQINLSRPHAGKLSLNKKTISNLNATEMNKKTGGNTGWGCLSRGCHGKTQNGNSCPGHNTCYNC